MNLIETPEMPDVCLSFVLLFTIFIIVVTRKLVIQQSKNVTAKCTENLSPPPWILYLLASGCKNRSENQNCSEKSFSFLASFISFKHWVEMMKYCAICGKFVERIFKNMLFQNSSSNIIWIDLTKQYNSNSFILH